jgi:hypothetical protein
MRNLINWNFQNERLRGLNFGDIYLTAMNEIYSNISEAILKSTEVLNITGRVMPVTLDEITICAELTDGTTIKQKDRIPEVVAEKVETILSRGILNTRPRDFYDIYILCTTKNYDKSLFKNALQATSAHRRTDELIKDVSTIISNISNSDELKTLWSKYQKKFSYAKDISFEHTVKKLEELLN